MKTKFYASIVTAVYLLVYSSIVYGQKNSKVNKYLEKLPDISLQEKSPQKYVITSEYFNMDIYGNVGDRTKITGEYTRGFNNGKVSWNNVYVIHSKNPTGPYPKGIKQDYMENFTYIPSKDATQESFFDSFGNDVDNIFARNLIWDMMGIETYAWNYYDSLQLNKTYIAPDVNGSINMAELGTYTQNNVELTWLGISMMNNTLCALFEYRAMDSKLDFHFDNMKSKGTDLQCGKIWVSLENKQIEYAEVFSNTVQEMEIKGLADKMMVKTKRILKLERNK